MADYKKMYATLCVAIDQEIDLLKTIPLARTSATRLMAALQDAENIYIETSAYVEETDSDKNQPMH